jgi:nitroimidazol reductase NimA-like FMN-containing flavoprotein (pyridoxamine 5'-phosphate oxidase superfamily)
MSTSNSLSTAELQLFLAEGVVPLRLACLDREGCPHVVSLWYIWQDEAIWLATRPNAWVVERLRADPRCGFEIAGDALPYRGIRGKGRAELIPERGEAVLGSLVDRYLGGRDGRFARWLLERSQDEMAIRIVPTRTTTWDYARRMS